MAESLILENLNQQFKIFNTKVSNNKNAPFLGAFLLAENCFTSRF